MKKKQGRGGRPQREHDRRTKQAKRQKGEAYFSASAQHWIFRVMKAFQIKPVAPISEVATT